jgi:hypothetical protein
MTVIGVIEVSLTIMVENIQFWFYPTNQIINNKNSLQLQGDVI